MTFYNRYMLKKFLNKYWVELIVLIVAVIWKIIWISFDSFPFNSDEAVVGLMAKHILSGERPIYFYGQSYMGSFDAWLVAGGFVLFGVKVWVIRLVQVILYLATILLVLRVIDNAFHAQNVKLFTGLLLAIPTVNILLYTTVSLGGYGEALFLGILYVFLFQKIQDNYYQARKRKGWVLIALLGFFIGFGLWANALTLLFSVPVVVTLLIHSIKRFPKGAFLLILALLLTIFLGMFPTWIYMSRDGAGQVLKEAFGSAVAVEHGSWGSRVCNT